MYLEKILDQFRDVLKTLTTPYVHGFDVTDYDTEDQTAGSDKITAIVRIDPEVHGKGENPLFIVQRWEGDRWYNITPDGEFIIAFTSNTNGLITVQVDATVKFKGRIIIQ